MLSLVLPTYNEAANLPSLLPAIGKALQGLPHEIIVVDDDSPDKTWEVAEKIAQTQPSVSIIRRRGEKGLSSAVVEGFNRAKGEILVVMDADGQHDMALLRKLYDEVTKGADVAVASRYVPGGSTTDWRSDRKLASRIGTVLAKIVLPVAIKDPMSGFFAVRKDVYRSVAARLRPTGFKILFEILAHLPSTTKLVEVPMTFGLRTKGKSKASFHVMMQFVAQLLRTFIRRSLHFLPWIIFLLCILGTLLSFGSRAWALRLLYLDPAIRTKAQTTLQSTSDTNGWLLSEMVLVSVSHDAITIIHRDFLRGIDPSECLILPFDGSAPVPCEN